ncbi:MAG: metallophosphoesterase family protein [Proteobacteria bacterium]|jgi:putative phosphoesterase|nr:metallophosphoesterase family protein [Pseudomonadota bacterium]MDA1300613.1 metallophosphoesterase family protein [Pseudomonadota bacterium]
MKILVFSDIHSNIHALEAIWKQENDSDLIYCIGDLVDYGPYPKEVLNWVREHDVISVMGNHDQTVAQQYRKGRFLDTLPLSERMWVNHNVSQLDDADIAYLEQLPMMLTFSADGFDYALTHIHDGYREIKSLHQYETFRNARFGGAAFTRLLLGHTHRQAVRYLSDDLLWLNPGSGSYRRPDDPDKSAHYATIVDGRISLGRVAFDHGHLYRVTQQLDINDAEKGHGLNFWRPLA